MQKNGLGPLSYTIQKKKKLTQKDFMSNTIFPAPMVPKCTEVAEPFGISNRGTYLTYKNGSFKWFNIMNIC